MIVRPYRFLVAVCLVLSFAQVAAAKAKADVVVVAELIRQTPPGSHCGVMAVVAEAEYRVLKVVKGEPGAKRIVVEILCPEMTTSYHVSELRLSSKKWFHYKPMHALSNPPQKRFQLVKQVASRVDYAALLGQPEAVLEKRFTRTESKDWQHYGPGLQAKIEERKVAVIRLPCPSGFPRNFPWAGLPTLTWATHKRRGGHSVGTFTGPGGIVGVARGGWIEISKPPK